MRQAVLRNDKRILMITIILVGVLGLGLVVTTAYAASIKYQINETIRQNDVLRGEIENLTVQVNGLANIETVEVKAQNELGMVYPKMEEFVFIAAEEEPPADFAMIIKSEAYQ